MSNPINSLVSEMKKDLAKFRGRILTKYADKAEEELQIRGVKPQVESTKTNVVVGLPKGDPSLRTKEDRKIAKTAFENAAGAIDIHKIVDEAADGSS